MKGLLNTNRGKGCDFMGVVLSLGNSQQTLLVALKLLCIAAFPEMNKCNSQISQVLFFFFIQSFENKTKGSPSQAVFISLFLCLGFFSLHFDRCYLQNI